MFTLEQRNGRVRQPWYADLKRAIDQVDGQAFDLGLPGLPELRGNGKTRDKGDQAMGDFSSRLMARAMGF